MSGPEEQESLDFWNRVAADWQIQVGNDGDRNRILNLDPVLWKFAGDVSGLKVLDAGCGTGYLSKKLREKGAHVTGVDFSEKMIDIAHAQYPDITFYVDSCSDLRNIDDQYFDLVIANYLIMDTPDLRGTMASFSRVLKGSGMAVLVFPHPCFPQRRATVSPDGEEINYHWRSPYSLPAKCVDPPWAHFTSEFIWFHRPLSDYWKSFIGAGFVIVDFEEPTITEDKYHLFKTQKGLKNWLSQPCSVAFKLQRKHETA